MAAYFDDSNATAWYYWVTSSASTGGTCSTSTSSNNTAWYAWNNSTGTSTTTAYIDEANEVWERWTENQHSAHVQAQQQELARKRRIREARIRRMKELRAKRLLKQHLNEEQRAMLNDKDHFYMRAASGQLYRIRNGRSGNVDVMHDESRRQHSLCAHPNDYCPNYDTMLAQKLMLETNEEEFKRIANIHH